MRLAYLTTAYPEVSHTFIRREIDELERRGHAVQRIAVRRHRSVLVDARDLAEEGRTVRLLDRPAALALALVSALLRTPLRFARALGATLGMSRQSERGLLRHLAYLVEACLLERLLARAACEHLHVHFGTNAAAVARLARLLGGIPYSVTVHGPDEFDAPIGLALREKADDAVFVVAISHFCAAQLRRWLRPESWPKVRVVRCTIGEEFLEPVGPIPDGSRSFVCVGRLSAQKGQLLLIEAFAELIARGADANLVLAGDGELRGALEVEIARRGLRDRVSITGWIDAEKVRSLLRDARALVLPSSAEGLPVVIMEALALGRPVISTHVAAIPELVEAGRSGWLVPAGMRDPLVAALEQALALPTVRLDEMGAIGRRATLAQHETRSEVAKLETLFVASAAGRGA